MRRLQCMLVSCMCIVLCACQSINDSMPATLTVDKTPAKQAVLITQLKDPTTCRMIMPRLVKDQLAAKPLSLPAMRLVTIRIMQLNPYGKRFVTAISWKPALDGAYHLKTSLKKVGKQVVFRYQLLRQVAGAWKPAPFIQRDFQYYQELLAVKQSCHDRSVDMDQLDEVHPAIELTQPIAKQPHSPVILTD